MRYRTYRLYEFASDDAETLNTQLEGCIQGTRIFKSSRTREALSITALDVTQQAAEYLTGGTFTDMASAAIWAARMAASNRLMKKEEE